MIQEHSKHGNFRKKKTIILSRYMRCSWAGTMFAEYIRLIVSRLGLPSKYDYWLAEDSPIIPQKNITTNSYPNVSSLPGSKIMRMLPKGIQRVEIVNQIGASFWWYVGYDGLDWCLMPGASELVRWGGALITGMKRGVWQVRRLPRLDADCLVWLAEPSCASW